MSTLTDEIRDLALALAERADDEDYVGLASARLFSLAERVGTLEAFVAPANARCERLPPEVIDGRAMFHARSAANVVPLPHPFGPGTGGHAA